MSHTFELFLSSVKSILSVFLVASSGILLAKFAILDRDSIRTLSRIVFSLSLPCLLFTNVSASIDFARLTEWFFIPFTCAIYVVFGLAAGMLATRLFKTEDSIRNLVITACAFSNSGYLPIPLMLSVTAIFPVFMNSPEAQKLAISYISVFLIAYSPLLWTVGYTIVSEKKIHKVGILNILTPPIIGMALGVIFGLIPELKTLLCIRGSSLFFIYEGIKMIGDATVPCSMFVLGGNLFLSWKNQRKTALSAISPILVVKLLVMPLASIPMIMFLRHFNLIPQDTLCSVVLILIAAAPPATNLAVMCSLLGKSEDEMASILFKVYVVGIFTLTFFLFLGMKIFG